MSQYSKEHPKSTKKQISTAWSGYKKQHGIVPAAKAKKAKGAPATKKAPGKKNGKIEKKTAADKIQGCKELTQGGDEIKVEIKDFAKGRDERSDSTQVKDRI
jgi:hypothetical protein